MAQHDGIPAMLGLQAVIPAQRHVAGGNAPESRKRRIRKGIDRGRPFFRGGGEPLSFCLGELGDILRYIAIHLNDGVCDVEIRTRTACHQDGRDAAFLI